MKTRDPVPLQADRPRLEALASEGQIRSFLEKHLPSSASREWHRLYGRYHPGREPYARLVYSRSGGPQHAPGDLHIVEAFTTRPEDSTSPPGEAGPLGWLLGRAFPSDDLLPTLPEILRSPGKISVLRYRPGRRCAVKLEQGRTALYGKVFCDEIGARHFHEGKLLKSAEVAGRIDFRVAAPVRWDARTRCFWQEEVPGHTLDTERFSRTGDGGGQLACRTARAAASLARWGITAPTETSGLGRFSRSDQLSRGARDLAELARRLPGATTLIARVSRELVRVAHISPCSDLLPIHGSLHAKQWLDDGRRLGLVDFEKFCLGEPELDAGTFLAELEFEDAGTIDLPGIEATFRDAYRSAGAPLREQVLLFYRAQKRVAKAVKAAQSLRIDGAERAARNLAATLDLLVSGAS